MGDEARTPGAGGTGAGAGSVPGAGTGSASGAAPNPGGTPPITPPAGVTSPSIPLDVLPEPLRGLPEQTIKFTLNRMAEGLAQANQRNKELEAQLRTPRSGGPSTTVSRPKPEEGGEPAKPAKKLDEWLLEDPESALDDFLSKRFGGAVQKLSEVEERIGRAELSSIRSELDDFSEVEEEVMNIIEQSGVPKTRENILGAYTMALGQRTIEERKRARRAAENPETPANEGEVPKKNYAKSSLTEEVRLSLGMSEEDYYEKFSSSDNLEIKVPR